MPTLALDLLVAGLAVVVLLCPIRLGFVVTLAAVVLTPAPLPIANPITHYATFSRVLVIAMAVRLLLGIRAGEVPRAAWRWTVVHTAFVVFLGCVYLAGIVWAPSTPPGARVTGVVVDLVDQLLFFVVVLATVRVIGDLSWVMKAVAGVLLVSAGMGVIEHLTGASWGHWLFKDAHVQTDARNVLESRAGDVRVRAGAEYALQYGWVIVMLVPILIATLARWRAPLRRWVPVTVLVAGLVLLAEYWSYSRTALASVGIVVVIAAVAARERRLIVFAASAAAVGLVAFLSFSALQHGFVGLPSGYVDVRTQRLPAILGLAAAHPLHGVGLGGLAALQFRSTDTSYLQLYGDTGLAGLVSLLALLVTVVACCARGLAAADRTVRLAAGAALAGSVAMIAGGFAFDAFRSLSSARPFWVVAAIGIVAAEQSGAPVPRLVVPRLRVLAGAVGAALAVGIVIAALAPVHYAQQYQFTTVSAAREAKFSDPVTSGKTLIGTVCGVADPRWLPDLAADTDCRDLGVAAGVGELRVQTTSAHAVASTADDIEELAGKAGITSFRLAPETTVQRGRATPLAWAPFWLPAATLFALVLIPRRRTGGSPR